MGVCCAPSWFCEEVCGGGCTSTVRLSVFSHFIVIGGIIRTAKGELLFVGMKAFVPCPSFRTIKTLLSCSGSFRIWELSCVWTVGAGILRLSYAASLCYESSAWSLVFAKNTSASRCFSGVLTKVFLANRMVHIVSRV